MRLQTYPILSVPFYRIPDSNEDYAVYNGAGIAPHARTARQTRTYINPDSVFMSHISISLRRVTVAGTPGVVTVEITFNPSIADVIMHTVVYTGNLAGDVVNLAVPVGFHIYLPVNVKIYTTDTSIGGTMDYNIFVGLFKYPDVRG